MRFIHAILQVHPDKAALYEETFETLKQACLEREPGTLVFELARDPETPNGYRVFEAYRDLDAIMAHVGTDYYKTAAAVFVECIAGDHMDEIRRRGLVGREMYDVVKTVKMERFDTL
jgi:quinol monooxygenase YgiN